MQIKNRMIRTTGYYGFDSGVHNKGSNKVLSLNGKRHSFRGCHNIGIIVAITGTT